MKDYASSVEVRAGCIVLHHVYKRCLDFRGNAADLLTKRLMYRFVVFTRSEFTLSRHKRSSKSV